MLSVLLFGSWHPLLRCLKVVAKIATSSFIEERSLCAGKPVKLCISECCISQSGIVSGSQ